MSDVYDYAPAVALATRMIAKFGRTVSLVKSSVVVGNPAFPLHGPGPSNPPATIEGIRAAFVEPSSNMRLGRSTAREGVWKEVTQIMLIAADGVHNFDDFTSVVDSDGSTWKIAAGERLQPGDTVVMFFIGVKR